MSSKKMGEFKASKVSRFAALTTAFQEIHAVDARRAFTVNLYRLTNVSGSAVTVSLCEVPPAGSPLASNAVLWDFSIPANNFIEFGEGDIIRNVSVRALASSNNAVNIKLSGTEESSI